MLSSFQVFTKHCFFILTSEVKCTCNLTSLDQIFCLMFAYLTVSISVWAPASAELKPTHKREFPTWAEHGDTLV